MDGSVQEALKDIGLDRSNKGVVGTVGLIIPLMWELKVNSSTSECGLLLCAAGTFRKSIVINKSIHAPIYPTERHTQRETRVLQVCKSQQHVCL